MASFPAKAGWIDENPVYCPTLFCLVDQCFSVVPVYTINFAAVQILVSFIVYIFYYNYKNNCFTTLLFYEYD